MNETDPKFEIDILKRVEGIVQEINNRMSGPGKSVFKRYPVTFTLLALFGVVAVSEGVKGIIESLGIFNGHPWYMLLTGLLILIFTGSLYKKLSK